MAKNDGGFDRLSRKLEAIPENLARGLVVVVKNEFIGFRGDMDQRLGGQVLGGLHLKEAALIRSQHSTVSGTKLNDIKGVASIGGLQAPHAILQQYGGILRAKNSRLLAVPVGKAFTKGLRLRENLAGFLKNVPNVSIFKSKRGNLVALRRFNKTKKSKTQSGEIIAVLKESVRVPPRLEYYQTWEKRAFSRKARLAAALKKAIDWKPGAAK